MRNAQMCKRMHLLNIGARELADQVGVKPSMIYMILSGQKQPSIGLAFKIARALHSTVDDLFGDVYGA